jgi:beta-phosphoglucomutase
MSLPKACIFDLDGVIVDTVDAHYKAWKTMADELGVPFTMEDNEHLKGVSRVDSMRRILALGEIEKTEEELMDYTRRKNDIYLEIISKMTPDDILVGVKDFIQLLIDNGVEVALGSSSKNTPTILKAVGLDKTFKAVVDGNQVTHSKPHPEVFLKGAERLGFEPKDCVVFEDAISGVEAAKRAGMKCIGVGEAEVLFDADLVVPDLSNINLDTLRHLS